MLLALLPVKMMVSPKGISNEQEKYLFVDFIKGGNHGLKKKK